MRYDIDKKKPKVYITPEAKLKMDLYIKAAGTDEISGLGSVSKYKEGILIEELYLLQQENTPGSTELDFKAVNLFITDWVKKGFDISIIRLWWHSHGSMSAFWSSIDDETIEKLNKSWWLSIVGTTSGEYKARIDISEPIKATLDELPIEIVIPTSAELEKEIKAEVKKKVKKKSFITNWKEGWGPKKDKKANGVKVHEYGGEYYWWDNEGHLHQVGKEGFDPHQGELVD